MHFLSSYCNAWMTLRVIVSHVGKRMTHEECLPQHGSFRKTCGLSWLRPAIIFASANDEHLQAWVMQHVEFILSAWMYFGLHHANFLFFLSLLLLLFNKLVYIRENYLLCLLAQFIVVYFNHIHPCMFAWPTWLLRMKSSCLEGRRHHVWDSEFAICIPFPFWCLSILICLMSGSWQGSPFT